MQKKYVHDFLNLTCTTQFPSPYDEWCRYDDYSAPIYYHFTNRSGFELTFTPPSDGLLAFEQEQNPPIRPEPVVPTEKEEHVVSKFFFRYVKTGEVVEYIEPLVSHLRFPLARCLPVMHHAKYPHDDGFVITKSYLMPPSPKIRASRRQTSKATETNPYHDRYLFFDAGASSWSKGAGGPSLEYFAKMWPRHCIDFDEVYAFEAKTPAAKFYQTVPNLLWSDRTVYQQGYVTSQLEDDTPATPFIPKFIQDHATMQDYVIFKLDIDSPGVEVANIEYLHQQDLNNAHLWIDELFWEHHVPDNPFIYGYWFKKGRGDWNQSDPTMRGSYNYFLRLRQLVAFVLSLICFFH